MATMWDSVNEPRSGEPRCPLYRSSRAGRDRQRPACVRNTPARAGEVDQHLLRRRPAWHLDEVYLKIDGHMVYLWRAVDAGGEVLDVLVQSKRNKHAALKLMRKLLRKYAVAPERLVTDDLRSYRAATLDLGIDHLHDRGRWKNNRAENRISRPDGGSARCNASRAAQPRSSSQRTPPSTTLSTPNAISRQLNLTACLCAAAMTTWREAVAAAWPRTHAGRRPVISALRISSHAERSIFVAAERSRR